MKKLILFFAVAVMAIVTLTSCSNDEPKTNDNTYVGTYKGSETTIDEHYAMGEPERYEYTLIIRSDNTFTVIDTDITYDEEYRYDGTYVFIESENTLYLTLKTESYYNWGEFEYSRPMEDNEGFYLKSNDNWKTLLARDVDDEDWEKTPLVKVSNKY